MLGGFKRLAAPLLALTMLSASALQANGQSRAEENAAPAAAPAAFTASDLNAWLDGFMPLALANGDIVGAVVTVVADGRVIANRGYGFADLAARAPVDPETTLFRPGSISKLFTWTAVMQLVEQGRIDLDADINTYLDFVIPDYQGAPITMRQIMTHTAGFEEVVRDLIASDPAAAEMSLGDYLKTHLPARIYPPGTMPAYSNYATALAGYVVERVSGEPFAEYLEAHIFTPLGMESATFVQPLPEAQEGAMSRGYRNLRDGAPQPFEIIPAAPAGAMTVSGADMARFMIAHLNGGAGLLRPETAALMHESIDQQFPGVNSMALGFYQERYNGERMLAHGGDTQWFHSNLSLFMDRNVGVYISVNSGGGPSLSGRLMRWEFMQAFANRYFPIAYTPPAEPLETARAHGAAVMGAYESARRAQTSPLLAVYFVGQTEVAMLPNGDLVGPGLPDVNGAPKHWREVEPWVWQAVGRAERMSARVDEQGRVTAIAFEPLSFAIASTRAPWYRAKTWLLPMLAIALGVLALTFISWPLRALARWVHKVKFPYEGPRAQAHRIGGAASLLLVAYIGAWAGVLIWIMESLTSSTGGAMNGPLMALYVAGLIPILAVPALALANFSLWRARATWFARIWSALVLLSALAVLWFAAVMNFFSFNLNY